MLKLADTRIMRFVERGGVEGRLIVSDRNGRKDIIIEEEVVDIIRPQHNKVYAGK
jgi:hypothetical protein